MAVPPSAPTSHARRDQRFAARPTRAGLVVEDQSEVRDWLCNCLTRAFDDMVVTGVPTLRAARAWLKVYEDKACEDSADQKAELAVALIDLGLPDGSGVELVRHLTELHPAVSPIIATIYDDDAHLFEAIAAGARGYLLKHEETDLLVDYLRRIERGEPSLSPAVAHRILAHFRAPPASFKDDASLSPRETEVLALLAKGMTVAETAVQLGLKPQTVASYVKIVYQKLNISTRAEATREAMRRGLS